MTNWKKISLEDLAGLISDELKKSGIEAIPVGGACVTIYSSNRYQSHDLDKGKSLSNDPIRNNIAYTVRCIRTKLFYEKHSKYVAKSLKVAK
jgi:hypothetical protein